MEQNKLKLDTNTFCHLCAELNLFLCFVQFTGKKNYDKLSFFLTTAGDKPYKGWCFLLFNSVVLRKQYCLKHSRAFYPFMLIKSTAVCKT